ncbi:PfkB family carbohydrate kinase [Pelagicoccus mobilis]|uniref:Carbohydrate kinase n=1 Tax=Pelagicoccus mobilis TaxID=415221 RepID=A0A934VPK1_9BACT|nr:PfkB family carbohydrate kinase [Pelagicoccus mobilis]MBK1875900.1 carbohydrate kinase [Pelagicoccus mobilis]
MKQETSAALTALADRVKGAASSVGKTPVVIGFDAFVDESLRIVGERTSPVSFKALPTISDFGAWASASAGRSGSREFVCEEIVAGGCSVNMGDGIASMGFPLNAFSGVGTPANPAFGSFVEKCVSVDPVGMEPGRALVTEFDDGKLMFCSFSHFANFTPEYLKEQMADGRFANACSQAKGIALTSWSVYPYMTDCWRYLMDEALSGISHRPHFFFDLADPASRTKEDMVDLIDTIGGFEKIGRVTLSVNGNEANRLASAVGLNEADETPAELERLSSELRERAGISEFSIHLVKTAVTATASGVAKIDGPYCAKPVRSVGAGDRFNAGFFAGLMLGLEPEERLQLGAASSGFFVRNARSASCQELTCFIRSWAAGEFDDG